MPTVALTNIYEILDRRKALHHTLKQENVFLRDTGVCCSRGRYLH